MSPAGAAGRGRRRQRWMASLLYMAATDEQAGPIARWDDLVSLACAFGARAVPPPQERDFSAIKALTIGELFGAADLGQFVAEEPADPAKTVLELTHEACGHVLADIEPADPLDVLVDLAVSHRCLSPGQDAPDTTIAELRAVAGDILCRYREVIGGDVPPDVAEEIAGWEQTLGAAQ